MSLKPDKNYRPFAITMGIYAPLVIAGYIWLICALFRCTPAS